LLILASGPPAAEPVARPAFAAIGRKTVWLGDAGQGSQLKLAVNAYMSTLIEGVAEALELAGRLGVDPSKLDEAIEGGPWTRRSRTPSCTRWSTGISRRSSCWNGR
jgi:3-hydroxyisobutyrate dehydrogenase